MKTSELTEFAAEQQRRFDATTSPRVRKEQGHFGTPPLIAEFMAGMFAEIPKQSLRILDPGAGVGTLSAAVCQRVLDQNDAQCLDFELYESDSKLISLLEKTMAQCQRRLRAGGHEMKFLIRVEDFILANSQDSLFACGPEPTFDLAILNPPYSKVRKASLHSRAMKHVIHGQPNMYALFMAVSTDLLLSGGQMVAITPRSYFSGPYFKRFRKWFFERLTARQIHVFDSRTEAFKEDAVLQENVILHAEKYGQLDDVILTTSIGRDLVTTGHNRVAYDKIIDKSNGDHVVRISTNSLEQEIIEAMIGLPHRLRDIDIDVSTGPVVTFRSTEFLRHERAKDTAPLLWMRNIRPFVTRFPPKSVKPEHIVVSEESSKLLVPAKTYVLLKRFTTKEEKRRLVAGIFVARDSYSDWVGLENHVNYVYRRGAELQPSEALGLAAYFNSALVDRYFRAISGNTQVNATEIRGLPIPDQATLMRIGNEIEDCELAVPGAIEPFVCRAIGLPLRLIEQLSEIGS